MYLPDVSVIVHPDSDLADKSHDGACVTLSQLCRNQPCPSSHGRMSDLFFKRAMIDGKCIGHSYLMAR
jgi:hypothetical protein